MRAPCSSPASLPVSIKIVEFEEGLSTDVIHLLVESSPLLSHTVNTFVF